MSRLSASSCGLRFGRVGLVPAPALPQAFAQHPRTRCPRGSPQAPPPGALVCLPCSKRKRGFGKQRVRIRGGVGFCSTPSVHFSHSARALSPSPADPGARPGGHAPPSSRSWGQRRPPACRPRPTIVCVGRRTRRGAHLERWRIWRRLRCRRRVLFFFHFHRNLARDFLYGFDLCAMPGAPCGRESRRVVSGWAVEQPRGCCVWCVRVLGDGSGQEQSRLASGTWFYSAVEGWEEGSTPRAADGEAA